FLTGSGSPPPSMHNDPISNVSSKSSINTRSILYSLVLAFSSISFPRVDPNRQGKHFPQLSCAVNSNKCSIYNRIGKSSGMQTIDACPKRNPFLANDSKSIVRSLIFDMGTNPPNGPPICMAFTGLRKPPPSSFTTTRKGVPMSTSYIPGLLKYSSSEISFVAVYRPNPIAAHASPPCCMIHGRLANVSTLFTTVGKLNNLCCAG